MDTMLILIPTVLFAAVYLLHQYRTRALEGPAEQADSTAAHPQATDETLKAA